jgi:hypothetical protein
VCGRRTNSVGGVYPVKCSAFHHDIGVLQVNMEGIALTLRDLMPSASMIFNYAFKLLRHEARYFGDQYSLSGLHPSAVINCYTLDPCNNFPSLKISRLANIW